MAQFLTPAFLQASDASANPLVGAKEFIYQTGTTTLLSLFSNEALTTPLMNPLESDSAGVFPNCFIAETKFKMVLTTAAGVILYTRDPVYSTGQADNVSASNVAFDGSGIGFSSTNVQDALVEMFGSVATLDGANFLGPVTATQNATGTFFQAVSTDDGAAAGPSFETYRNSASPAASDVLGEYLFYGKDSTDVKTLFGALRAVLLDPTNATEDADFIIRTVLAGTLADRMHVRGGAYMEGATSGDMGVGTFNATQFYRNGAALPFTRAFESTQQTITAGGVLTLAHGLIVQPKLYLPFLQCTTAEEGYSIADEVMPVTNNIDTGANGRNATMVPDATNIVVRYGNIGGGVFTLNNKTTGANFQATNASWRLVVRAWA